MASEITVHARQELVRRLDDYEMRHKAMFGQVVEIIEKEAIPIITRQALTGKAYFRSPNAVFEQTLAVDMFIDVMCERGYQSSHERQVRPVPTKVDLKTGDVVCDEVFSHLFEVHFRSLEIR